MIADRSHRPLDGKGAVLRRSCLLAVGGARAAVNLLLPPTSALPRADLSRVAARQISLLCPPRVALDLVWGYCGILSLGHGAFFALGGYAMGMYLMRQIGTRGVYAHPVLPDFMVFLNWKELPLVLVRLQTFRLRAC